MNKNNKLEKTICCNICRTSFFNISSAAVQFAIILWLTIQTESAITLTIASVVAFLPNMLIDHLPVYGSIDTPVAR